MAVTTENNTWENVSPSIEQTQENFFSEWAGIERKFGEFGAPGYSEQTITVRNFAAIFGHSDPVDVRFTLYRGEDGLLLCIHGCYLENGIQNRSCTVFIPIIKGKELEPQLPNTSLLDMSKSLVNHSHTQIAGRM